MIIMSPCNADTPQERGFFMKKILSNLLVAIIGMVTTLLSVMGYFPFMIGYIAAVMSSQIKRIIILISMLASFAFVMFVRGDFITYVKYSLLMVVTCAVIFLLEERTRMQPIYCGFIAAVSTVIMEISDMLMSGISRKEGIIIGGLTTIVLCSSFVFKEIINFIIMGRLFRGEGKEKRIKKINNQELFYAIENKLRNVASGFRTLSAKVENKGIEMYLKETGNIFKSIADEIIYSAREDEYRTRLLIDAFRNEKINIKNIIVNQINGKKQYEITVKERRRTETNLKFIERMEKIVSEVLNKSYICEKKKQHKDTYVFSEDVNYVTLFGVARKAYEDKNGDNFSYSSLDRGQTFLSISDGMGTGVKAFSDSKIIVEIIEEFKDLGFSDEIILKMINLLFVNEENLLSPATLDLSVIDMYSGVCNIMKLGAATTFIKRGEWVEAIKSTSLPVGVVENADIDSIKRKLYDGDLLIMVSDGIIDSIEDDDKEKVISKLILDSRATKPKELANELLSKVMNKVNNQIRDDMTVMVTGLWSKVSAGVAYEA